MKILDMMKAANGRVSGGDSYLWKCYGNYCQIMEFRDVAGKGYAHCVFDTNTYDVREVHVEVPGQDMALRWIDPQFLDAFINECKDRHIVPNHAWDDVVYFDVGAEQILEYVKDVGEMYYDDLPVPCTE